MIQVLKNVFKDPKRFKVATLQVWPRSYGIFRIYVQVMGRPKVCLKNHGISEKCGTVGVASLQVWPRIVVK